MTVAHLAVTVALAFAGAPAAPPDPAKLEAVTEIKEDEWPSKVQYEVRRGDVVRAPLGVISMDDRPVAGLVAQLDLDDRLDFARRYRNCWYTTDAGHDIAWCEFPGVLPAYSGRAITTPVAVAAADAEPGTLQTIGFRWQSKKWADARGGLKRVTAFFAGPGAAVVRGTDGSLTLEKLSLPTADIRANGNFIRTTVNDEPPLDPSPTPTSTPSPTPTSTPTPTPTPTRSATTGPAAGVGAGEELPVTGTPTATLAAAGGLLLALGLVARRIARRRVT
ncbi:LPXTG cell wall anchor domain-containing protein [Actinoplanes sp. NPDC049548]|uniref:LPXTG cell wall anchor domain-containing protein n=1 Tax=Actinoplanes sp. NPDC049548 TaxID=3155152 RepID=UPI003442D677